MSTLTLLKARIADDLARGDISQQIGEAINDAIAHYQSERFYFNESRTAIFSTVIGQREYTPTDTVVNIDALFATVSGDTRLLSQEDPYRMELRHDASTTQGPPTRWAYYGQKISLYPLPDAVYTMRIVGQIKAAAPADDATAGNVWMTEAFELLRASAKLRLAVHVLRDDDMAAKMDAAVNVALQRLHLETALRTGMGRIVATHF